ncbi:conserved hypothetical protein, partial [Ricinus communis]
HRIAILQALGRHHQEVLRLVRHVVRRRLGRTAILADVGTQERVVAHVARPLPTAAARRRRRHRHAAAQRFDPLRHADQAKCVVARARRRRWRQADAVVGHAQRQAPPVQRQRDVDPAGLCVAAHIGQRLLHTAEQHRGQCARHGGARALLRQLQRAGQAAALAELRRLPLQRGLQAKVQHRRPQF